MLKDIRNHPYFSAVLLGILIACALLLTGCATPTENARSLLDRLEFEEGEYGTFELEGSIDLNPIPLFSTTVHMKLEKIKPQPIQTDQVAP